MEVNNKFKALFNPFTLELSVLYGSRVSNYRFDDLFEWTKISFNGDTDHPNYLHIQLDYDGSFQLIFYPRQDNDEELHEDKSVCFNSDEMDNIPEEITLVYNDKDWLKLHAELVGELCQVEVESGL